MVVYNTTEMYCTNVKVDFDRMTDGNELSNFERRHIPAK
jgi:hypothetical protein